MLTNRTLNKDYFDTWLYKNGYSITFYDYLIDTLKSALEEGRYSTSIKTVVRTLTEEEFNSREFVLICNSLPIDTFYLNPEQHSIIFTFDGDINVQNKFN